MAISGGSFDFHCFQLSFFGYLFTYSDRKTKTMIDHEDHKDGATNPSPSPTAHAHIDPVIHPYFPNGNHSYEEGRRDGRIDALEQTVNRHGAQLSNHERRLIYVERIIYGILGIIVISTVWPTLEAFLNVVSKTQ